MRSVIRQGLRASTLILALVFALVPGTPTFALGGKSIRYLGHHPLPPHTGQFCYIDLLHVHAIAPSDMRAYRVLAGREHVYVGDESAVGYDGPRQAYFGPHPLRSPEGAEKEKLFCYLRGAHFHAVPPATGDSFVLKDGAYWFMGTFPPEFARDRFYSWVNDIRPIAGYRPPQVVPDAAPPGYRMSEIVSVLAPVPAPPPVGSADGGKGKAVAKRGTKAPPPSVGSTKGAP